MKPIFKVDKKAPRTSKKEFSNQVVNKELYNKFKKELPQYNKLTWKEFQEVWKEITETIRYEAVYNPLGVKLGYYLGEIKTQFLPYKFKAVNREASIEEGEEINFLNIITRGKVGKVKWERRWAVRFNKILQFYGFEEDRKTHDLAKKHITQNPEQLRVSRVTTGGKRTW